MPTTTRSCASAVRAVALLGVLLAVPTQATVCSDLCSGVAPNPCVVGTTVNVSPGSVIDCSGRTVQVSGGSLRVTNGSFTLKAASLTVSSSKKIESLCSGAAASHGFRIETTGSVTVGTGSSLRANCTTGGGTVTIMAGTTVSIGGTGIDAGGTTATGRGGSVRIAAGGNVTTTAAINAGAATTTGTGVAGGGIDIRGASLAIGGDLTVSGYRRNRGQFVRLQATGDITVTAGTVNAGTASGNGGVVLLIAGGTIDVRRPLKANGVGAESAGGFISLRGDAVKLTRDVVVRGGDFGGSIVIAATKRVDIGLGATQAFDLDADRASSNAGQGGDIDVSSEGHDVYIGPLANLRASSTGGGQGGAIEISGITVTAVSGSKIMADGSVDEGGTIDIEARGAMTLSGILHATNGEATFTYRQDGPVPTVGANVTGDWSVVADDLDTPCGDGVRWDPTEQCDAPDMDGQACCTATCTACN